MLQISQSSNYLCAVHSSIFSLGFFKVNFITFLPEVQRNSIFCFMLCHPSFA